MDDAAHPGRPRRHDETARSTVIALARTKPRRLGYPFELWTLARLQRAIQERVGLQVAQGTIWQGLQAEGVVWKRQQRWFQVTVEGAFAEQRGPSSRRTRRRGSVWGLGACEPATGLATTLCRPRRESASVIQRMAQVLRTSPARQWVLSTDNLSTHRSRDTHTALIA